MIIATNNEKKIEQIRMLAQDINFLGLKEAGIEINIDEDGETFEENAVKKAVEIYNITHEEVLADDSGLCIDYFDGWPGVYSNRFIPNSSSYQRNEAILEKMKNVDDDLRGASHVCVLAFCDKDGNVKIFRSDVKFKIAKTQRGDNFFGFDPIALLDCGKTLAELSNEEKIKYNARGKAFDLFLKDYREQYLK
ncbi:MAG: RdgB/HAM1 family non-canonical purine NTP pyrophosphatase [Clostridia bacterium]|nr:RdgB/HAM1 family non-canonical purine NTP pyrophosphatase [Clostridia bacterium]